MKKLRVIEHKNQRVLTTAQLAEGYGTDALRITQNFNANQARYVEEKHYYCLKGADLKAFKNYIGNSDVVDVRAPQLYLWTEKGALLHAKSLNTDKAWEVYDQLVETYFRAKEMFNAPKTLSEALYLAAELQREIEEKQPLIAFAETAAQSKESLLIREVAKICCKGGLETGERRLFAKLREWGLLLPFSTEPYQRFVDAGYFEVAEGTHETNSGVGLHRTTRVLPKGQQYIMNRLRKEGA